MLVKRLHKLILRSFFGPFVLIFFIVLFVLLMQFLWRYIDELIGKGLEVGVIAEFLLYTSATLVPMALPLSILMSSLMTFGNLGEKYELTAIKASGISLQKVMRPLIVVVFFVSIGTFFFANNVLPFAKHKLHILLHDIRQQRPELQLKAGVFTNLIDGYSIRIQSKNPETNTMYGLQIYDHSEGKGNVSVTFADSGTMSISPNQQNLLMTLYHGHSYKELQDSKTPRKKRSYPHQYNEFEKQEFLIGLSGFDLERSDQSMFKDHYAMKNIVQLQADIDSIKTEITKKEEHVLNTLINVNIFKKRKVKEKRNIKGKNAKIKEKVKPTVEKLKKNDSASVDEQKILDSSITKKDSTLKKDVKKPDLSIESAAEIVYLNTDSLLNILTLREKSRIVGSAVSLARTSNNLVTNSRQTLDYKTHKLRRHEIEWHRKLTISFACLVFLFIGAPLGAIIRKGGLGLPLVLSVLFFILYYILSLTGEKLVRESIITAIQGMWLSAFVFSLAGAFLTYKATTDSSMLNMDTYLNFIKTHFGQKFNVVDKLSIEAKASTTSLAKIQNIKSTLITLQDNVTEMISWKKAHVSFSDVLVSLYSPNTDADLVQFERYYNNTFNIIINHPIFHNKNIRSKIYEFPSFNENDYSDKNWKLTLKIILACIPPLTILLALRQIIKLTLFEIKMKKIKVLIPELLSLININFPEDINENITTVQ